MKKLKAVFFDQDGVIIETERDGHRVSFNNAFKEFGLNIEWDVESYHELLQVGGGKERIKFYFQKMGLSNPDYDKDPDVYIKMLHTRKTELFTGLIKAGKLPLRPGVRRLMEEINSRGAFLGICTTSNEKAAEAVEKYMLQGIKIDLLLAGDVVKNKKPDPEIYQMALEKFGVSSANAFVVEDSRIGVLAGKGAGIAVIATVNGYTINEDVSSADIVVDCLGDYDGVASNLLKGRKEDSFDGIITCDMLESYL
jgi:HAD superfamily hydrolase (TIGR01509 family)